MLQYDLTNTVLFGRESGAWLPTEEDMFVITVALLLVHEAAYSDLSRADVEFGAGSLESVASCIEKRLPPFVFDFGSGQQLRERLEDFVGLRISCVQLLTSNEYRGSR